MSQFTVVYDANVFYPAPLRDLLLRLAATRLFRARWTAQIREEWVRNLVANRPDLAPERIQRTADLIDSNIHDCLVEEYEHLIPCIGGMPDKDDRHVLAAAMKCGAELIVTFNLKDFPNSALAKYGVEAIHPDDFCLSLIEQSAVACVELFHQQLAALRKPPISLDELTRRFERMGLPLTASRLRDELGLD